jgi:ABC-2 type transport system permease protein
MTAFLYGILLQWKLDIRSKTLLITCYLVPLSFFAMMGGIFTSILPGSENTLIQSMTVFGVTMGALIGLPPSLVEIYGSDMKKVYRANGVPLYWGLISTNLSAFIHLFLMSVLLYILAPLGFGAALPERPALYFGILAVFITVSLSIASVIGLTIKDQAKTSMFSILIFLPSILLSGIMFPVELLPKIFQVLGKLFPAVWGYKLMLKSTVNFHILWPLLLILCLASFLCYLRLKKLQKD